MRLSIHNNPTQEIARAPYNFVPLPQKVVTFDPEALPCQDRYYPDRHTGYIDCVITTESPIYVRAPLTPEEFERQEKGEDDTPWRGQVKNKADFFYTAPAKTPRIPGSSLRGMLRQLVEIASYSKVQWVSKDPLVYRAVGDTTTHGKKYRDRMMREDGQQRDRNGKSTWRYTPLVKAGYIIDDRREYYICPAQEISGATFARIRIDNIPNGLQQLDKCENASEIWFQAGPYEYQEVRGGFLQIKYAKVIRASAQPAPGLIKGALVRSGPMASKRTEAVVYPRDEKAERIPIPEHLVAAYKDQVSQEQEHLLGGKNGVLKHGQPVFYRMDGDKLIFFGHTMMMRLPYPYTPIDFVPEHLRSESDLDLAEAIFGYTKSTGEGKAHAYASRVFVGDALLASGQSNVWLSEAPIVPKILGGPKPTTFQHYLTQQTPDPQEQGRDRSGNPKLVRERSDYTDPSRSAIRGHKLYWHKGELSAADIQEALDRLRDDRGREKEHDTQHTQIKPVRGGVSFRWRIHFENLSDEELGALLWALTLPGQPGKQYRHSIGMGKPLGMGAVKIEPGLRLEDRQERYRSLFSDEHWCTGVGEADDRIPEFVTAFDRLIREQIGATRQANLAEVERIQMLLRMLEWPGPDKELTRYMEIERPDPKVKRGKINEYKNRPVLPDPLHITGGGRASVSVQTASQPRPVSPAPTQSGQRPSASPSHGATEPKATPAQPQPTSKPAVKAELELSRPASIDEVVEGMYLEGQVVRVESSRVVVDILGEETSLALAQIEPPIRDEYDLGERFPVGEAIRVIVLRRNKQGRLQLATRRK